MRLRLFFILFVVFAAIGLVLFSPQETFALSCYSANDYQKIADNCNLCSAQRGDVCGTDGKCYIVIGNKDGCALDLNANACVGPPTGGCTTTCTPSWSCTAWSPAVSTIACGTDNGTQTKTCTDSNTCGTTSGKPDESQTVSGTKCDSGTCTNGVCVVAATPAAPVAASSQITAPAAGTWQGLNGFNVSVIDTNATWCGYWVYSDPAGTTVRWSNRVARTCNQSFTVSVGTNGNCRNESTAQKPTPCQVHAYSFNGSVESADNYKSYAIDFTAPSAPTSVTYDPNSNTTGSHTVSWSGASDSLSGIASYNIRRSSDGGSTWTFFVNGVTGTSWQQSPAVSAGSYIYQVKAEDFSGNVGVWSNNTNAVTVAAADTVAPVVSISGAPANWQNTNATMVIACNDGTGVGCEGAGNWKYYTNINQISSCSTNFNDYPGTYSANGIAISSHLWICATAADTNGKRGYTQTPVEFEVDAISPLVSANNASDSWFTSRETTLTVSDSGGAILTEARYNWDSNAMNAACTNGGTVFSSGAALTVSEGSHRLYLCARDSVGNVATWDSGADKYRVDSIAPTVSSFTISGVSCGGANCPATAIMNTSFEIAWTVADNSGGSGIQRQEIWRAQDTDGDGNPNWPGIAFVPNAVSPYTDNPPEGTYWYGLHIVDNTNNCITEAGDHCGGVASDSNNTRTVRGPLKAIMDRTQPNLATLQVSPSNPGTEETIRITVSANDVLSGISRVAAYYGGSWNFYQCSTDANSCSHTFTASEPTVGSKTYSGYAYDRAGNSIATTPGSVTVTVEPGLTYPSGVWERLWYDNPRVNGFEANNFLGSSQARENQNYISSWINEQLSINWGASVLAYDRGDYIGFRAGRTINLMPGGYTFTVGADDGVRLFVNREQLVLTDSQGRDSWRDQSYATYRARKDISCPAPNPNADGSCSTEFEIQYYENNGAAEISFSANLGFTGDTVQGFACYLSPSLCTSPPTSLYYTDSWCGFNKSFDGYCYYNGTPSISGCNGVYENIGCSDQPTAKGTCTYQNRCQVQAEQTCTDQGCVEGIPPTLTIRTAPNNWYNADNLTINIDAADNAALDKIVYQIDNYTSDQEGTRLTRDGNSSNPLNVSSPLVNQSSRLVLSDWNNLPDGNHTIYLKAIDASGNCVGCRTDDKISLAVKKDTIPPLSALLNIASVKTGADPVGRYWFNVGKSISVEDKDDEILGPGRYSGLDAAKCYYKVRDLGRPEDSGNPVSGFRACGSDVSITVGSSVNTVCRTQGLNPITGRGYCYVYVQSYDLAGNMGVQPNWLNIDYTPPGAQ